MPARRGVARLHGAIALGMVRASSLWAKRATTGRRAKPTLTRLALRSCSHTKPLTQSADVPLLLGYRISPMSWRPI